MREKFVSGGFRVMFATQGGVEVKQIKVQPSVSYW